MSMVLYAIDQPDHLSEGLKAWKENNTSAAVSVAAATLLAGATSLPEVLAAIRSLSQAVPNLARIERRPLFLELDALVLILVYAGGLWLLYTRGT